MVFSEDKFFNTNLMRLPHTHILKLVLLLLISISSIRTIYAQSRRQSIQGRVVDAFTGQSLPGVNILVVKDSLKMGGFTGANGYFHIPHLPVGNYNLVASYIGYKTYKVKIELRSGKAANLEILLHQAADTLKGVSIVAYEDRTAAVNNMALIGARSFSPEETDLFAGSYGDPARMAMNFAGIMPVRDNRNDLIIRGNSAFGLQWRMDGVAIPNPNHFGASATKGGPVTIVNSNLIGRSDFFIGNYPAEYGDALAGVFDMRLKNANPENREMWLELGWNGLEFGSEGPFIKGKKANYLFAYRHSVANAFYHIKGQNGKEVDYQDMTVKLNFPETRTGNWSLMAMGGNSRILLDETKYSPDERNFESWGEVIDNRTAMGVVSLSNQLFPNKKMRIKTTIAATANKVFNEVDTFSVPQYEPFLWATENTLETDYSLSSQIYYKTGKNSRLVAGGVFDYYVMDFHDSRYEHQKYFYYTDTSAARAQMLQLHIGYKFQPGKHFETYLGLHSQSFFMNHSNALEPRLTVKYSISKKSSLSFGSGLYSQLQAKMMYYVRTQSPDGKISLTNIHLGFTRAFHNSLEFNHSFNKHLRIKTTAYYQYLYDVPVKMTNPPYSLLNFGTEYFVEREDSLANKGTGRNYGLEFTFEHFPARHLFYLVTATFFHSTYTSIDHVERSTAYDGRYVFNLLGGYELVFPKKYVSMNFGLNFTYAGGSPYVPFDVNKTLQTHTTQYDWENAYSVRRKDYARLSLRIGVKRNYKKVSTEMYFDLQYRDDYTSIFIERIDVTNGQIIDTRKMGFYPMGNIKLNF